jgi:hypothetical protein
MMVNGSRKAFGAYEHREGLRVLNSFTKPVPSYSQELGAELGIKAVEYAMLNAGSKLMPQIEQGVASLWSGTKSLSTKGLNSTKNFAQNIFARGKPQVPNILPKLRESNVGNSSGLVVVSDVKMAEKNVANIVAEDLSYTHSYDHHGHVPGHKRHAARVEGETLKQEIPVTQPVTVSAKRAIDIGKEYEHGIVNEIYKDILGENPNYITKIDGKVVKGIADKKFELEGKRFAVEAKYTESWEKSLRNPHGIKGSKPWSASAQKEMVTQAKKYSSAFDETIYHTNSIELIDHYTKVFNDNGIKNFKFSITPVIKK